MDSLHSAMSSSHILEDIWPVMRARYCNTARVSDGRQERTGQHSQERSVMVGETPHMDIAVVDVVLIPAQAHCVSHAATPFQGL